MFESLRAYGRPRWSPRACEPRLPACRHDEECPVVSAGGPLVTPGAAWTPQATQRAPMTVFRFCKAIMRRPGRPRCGFASLWGTEVFANKGPVKFHLAIFVMDYRGLSLNLNQYRAGVLPLQGDAQWNGNIRRNAFSVRS
jgi:hypothetical protein